MPWSVGDVEKHKKGLSDEQKKKWVATANAVLSKCIKDGGTDESCAPKAIRIANGTTNNEHYATYRNEQEANYEVKEIVHRGRTHYVVPVVMMVEGVHHGSHGPMYHGIDELGKYPQSWNGIPVVVNHPEIDGINVSANDPDLVDQHVGQVYHTHVDGTKLRAEAWIDVEKLKQISVDLVNQLQKGELVEVSLGMFTDDVPEKGDWNGETYEAIAKGHRPDHLALLPGAVGACSIEDGCGIRVNSEDGETVAPPHFTRNNFNINTKEVQEMADNVCQPCIKKRVDDLIANSQGKYTEDDRVMLETLNESLLDKIAQPVIQEKEVVKEVVKEIEINVLSDEDKADLTAYRAQRKAERDGLVKTIQDNLGKEVWTDEVLSKMETSFLKTVAEKYIKEQPVDYSFNGSQVKINESKVRPMPPTGITFKTK